MLHTYSLFKETIKTSDKLHDSCIYITTLTRLMMSYLTSLNPITLEKLPVRCMYFKIFVIDSLCVYQNWNRYNFFLRCWIMHGLSFKCFVINHSSLLAVVIIFYCAFEIETTKRHSKLRSVVDLLPYWKFELWNTF